MSAAAATVARTPREPAPSLDADIPWCGAGRPMMGGRVDVRSDVRPGAAVGLDAGPGVAAGSVVRPGLAGERVVHRVLDRIEAWSARLTRFEEASELSRLNADPRPAVRIGPTLAAALDWSRVAQVASGGIVDVTLLDARLAAEHGTAPRLPAHRRWSLDRLPRGAIVRRPPGVRFDLDGVAKGWLADRALDRVAGSSSALVDADGDIALRLGPGAGCAIGIADPRTDGDRLATIVVPALGSSRRFGVATSGTTVHRWQTAAGIAHHLVDPRTGRAAATDVAQATVVAGSARHAEALAKTVVILGREAGLAFLARSSAVGAVLLTEGGDLLATGELTGWVE